MDLVGLIAAGAGVGAGLLAVSRRNPVYAALWMLVSFLALAVVYLKLEAPFLAAMHVLVYTGAILVLFLFVIMLLNLKPEELGEEYPLPHRALAALLCAGLFAALAVPLSRAPAPAGRVPEGFGDVKEVGKSLFVDYVLPFELISVLIVAATFAVVVLAKRKR